MVSLQQIEVEYHFENPLFDVQFNHSISNAWKSIIKQLIGDFMEEIDTNIYQISAEGLEENISSNNPESMTDELVDEISLDEEINLSTNNLILNLNQLHHATLTANSYDEIILFDRLILNNFPTYHQDDAKINTVKIANRLPISLIPTRFIRKIQLDLDESIKVEFQQCNIPETIIIQDDIVPKRKTLEKLIEGHLQVNLNKCSHSEHTQIAALKKQYTISDELQNTIDMLFTI